MFEAVGQLHLVEALEPGALGAGEALCDPVTLDEALDEDLLGDALGLEIVEDGLLEFAVVVRAFEGEDDGSAVRPCFRGLRRVLALPFAVRGPVDFWALRRLAAICLGVDI